MTNFLSRIQNLVWGMPMLVLLLGLGLYLSLRLGFVQLRLLPQALSRFAGALGARPGQGVSSGQAVCTALAATVGTGNLVGVAGAICLGGPGAVFWMWLCGLLGMATKFAEATLAVRYRVRQGSGWAGGPMYMMTLGLGRKRLAVAYCLFGLAASFGVGNAAQVNAVLTGVHTLLAEASLGHTRLGDFLLGLAMAAVVGSVLRGGASRIGSAAQRLVPVAAAGYLLLCAGVLVARRQAVAGAFAAIFQGAFSPRAVTGGMLGSAFQALRIGCSRGVFTNEAGMGTAAIAHGGAQVDHPVEQGMMGLVEVFLDTIVICTLTALVILVSGVPIPYGTDAGGALTLAAFSSVYGRTASVLLTLFLGAFAFATVLGWGLYGGQCARFLFGSGAWKGYTLAQTAVVALSAVVDTATVWQISETMNGLMAIPNLIALAALSPELIGLTKDFIQKKTGILDASGGNVCKFPSTPTAVNPLPCENSTPWPWRRNRKGRRSTT